ncbi:MAG: TonB-dependent receptor, partial [Bacteroidia bacterium]|nr:TonB-dependent receptor [Bacteroidia bacterium]
QIIDLQNDFLGIEKRRWVLANNTDIPVLESRQISAGIQYNRRNLTLSAEGYFKTVDGITTRSQGFQNQYQFVDAIGKYDVKGIDVLINKKFNNFSTWLSYSYRVNDYSFNDLNFGNSFPNNSDIRHATTLACSYNLNNFKISAGANWKTGKPYTEPNNDSLISENFINYSLPNSSQLDDYIRADVSANYKFKISNYEAEIGLSIWNVLNKKNTINTYYVLNDNTISKIENSSLGLTPNASFRLTF